MDSFLPFGSRGYLLTFALLIVARGMDILSTWTATPNLVLEGNPVAKFLGWRWGSLVNLAFCFGLAFWPLPAIVLSTTSILVASRNFQSAWLMRSLGEETYRDWHVARIQETPIGLYLLCLAGNTVLTALVGAAVVYFSNMALVPFGIGVGIMAYGGAVAFYTLIAVIRMRSVLVRRERRAKRNKQALENEMIEAIRSGTFEPPALAEQIEGK